MQRKKLDEMEWIFMIGPVDTDDGFYSDKRRNTLRAFTRELRGMAHALEGDFDKPTRALEEAVDIHRETLRKYTPPPHRPNVCAD